MKQRVPLGSRFQMFLSWEKKDQENPVKSVYSTKTSQQKKFRCTYLSKHTIICCIDFIFFSMNHLYQKLFLRTHLKIHNIGSTRSYNISNLKWSIKMINSKSLSLTGLCWNAHTLTKIQTQSIPSFLQESYVCLLSTSLGFKSGSQA